MNQKILFVANVHQHFLIFHQPYIQWLKEQGIEVHLAAGENQPVPVADKQFFLSVKRSPFHWQNIKAFFELKKILAITQYDLVHCHTPMGAVLARLAARRQRSDGKLKVIYTAHGFHFFKGAPLLNWMLYYPIEKWLSAYTDAIITINHEDYNLIKGRGFKNQETYRIDSIGVPTDRFKRPSPQEKGLLRKQYGYRASDFILIYAAEFIPRKNHRMIINALPILTREIPGLKVILAGTGPLLEKIKQYTRLRGFEAQVELPGLRNDIPQLSALSDVCISSSRQEGYGMHIAEAMFCGLPAVATEDRGHREMVVHGKNGYLFPQNNHQQFARYIIELYKNPEKRIEMGNNAFQSIQKCAIENSLQSMKEIYQRYL